MNKRVKFHFFVFLLVLLCVLFYLSGRPSADDVRSDERITNRSIEYIHFVISTDQKTFPPSEKEI